jgi:hypothetical protein
VAASVGGGGSIAAVNDPAVLVADIVTEKGSAQTFGGVEATFAGMPRFALSADVGSLVAYIARRHGAQEDRVRAAGTL